jgi:glyoxylase-like metal-dependent hydrolase (beta-lactamase superfamily II)/ferredoxin
MARPEARLPENAEGDLYVDSTCIDCDTCRQIAPSVFARSPAREMSFVRRQPAAHAEAHRARMALVACPTSSIGSVSRVDVKDAVAAFPERVSGDVYYCGFTSERSFGASSYLIVRPDGNVLVDSPRATEPLMRRIAELGGVRTMFLSHVDDVADHELWRARFGCTRVMHEADRGAGTREIERPVGGTDPVALADDLLVIPVPGHTAGSLALLYDRRFLFTGDHLWWSDTHERLHASRSVCWYSWPEQVASLRRLLAFPFEWVLPGHGRRFHAESAALMHEALRRSIEALATG